MAGYKKKRIGKSFSLTAEEILSQSVEDLIDQGRRFSLAQTIEDEDEETEVTDYVK